MLENGKCFTEEKIREMTDVIIKKATDEALEERQKTPEETAIEVMMEIVVGETSEEEIAEFLKHMKSCDRCATIGAEYANKMAVLREIELQILLDT